ncbi:MAG: nucleoside-diphosphate kinase [Verrucomicrobia bacterium]|nr:MAG: nucleoside-diphosphate kinase [Verrucomicrobiota bacterium]
MSKELAFALINPYTIAKSRTGGAIGRLMSRTGLDLVAARMFGPSRELVEKYAACIRNDADLDAVERQLLSDYVLGAYLPDARSGRRRRVLMLLFEGEDAVQKIIKATGHIGTGLDAAETVRDTYGDYVLDEHGKVRYFEPAVLIGASVASVKAALKLWAEFSPTDGGVVEEAADVPRENHIQKTLVLIKPDNFRFPSSRPGNIIDLFSGSGLRIVAAKVHRMSVAEAEQFYGPVQQVLREKLKGVVAEKAAKALAAELGFEISAETKATLGEMFGPLYGDNQFFQIIQFMTGQMPNHCTAAEKQKPGNERCLALIYAGPQAVEKIRSILGPTDPSKAQPGSVRREFGRDVMVNAAHASDSPENAARELKIVKVEEDLITPWVKKYFG